MGARVRTAPRKRPTQARAKATFDAIVDATARVLVRDGYEKASTNRVAEAAGVSVGSLYQYFPSKEALVCAVMERHCEEMVALFENGLSELASVGAPLEAAANVMVRQMIACHEVDPKLHRVLMEEVPRIGRLAKMDEMERRITELIAAFLAARREEIEIDDLEMASFILVMAGQAVIHKVVLDRPELLESGELEKQLVELVLRYLAPSRSQARLARRREAVRSAS